METYKIIYNSKLIKENFFFVVAENEKQAKKNFKKEYEKIGGNPANVLKVLAVIKTDKL